MKRSILIICSVLLVNSFLLAQKNESVTVKAGTKVMDYFPVEERYLYGDFTTGKAIFTNERTYPCEYNYNFLSGEMEFIKSNDTLTIVNKKDLISIVVAQDTFYYDSGYLQTIRSGKLKVYSKQYVKIKDILKKGAMGTVNRSAASESYDYLLSGPLSYDLVTDYDMVLQKTEVFFFSTTGKDFVPFNRINIISILPFTKNYIKSNKIKFKSREDILRLADYINESLS
jgi:hypothetical protein